MSRSRRKTPAPHRPNRTAHMARYYRLGLLGQVTNQFAERNFHTTWGMWLLILGELGGVGAIVWGFVSTQLLS